MVIVVAANTEKDNVAARMLSLFNFSFPLKVMI